MAVMCWKCTELDRRIGHLRKMVEHSVATEAANKMIEEIEAKKAKLHPEPGK
jgi:hypothetical protein